MKIHMQTEAGSSPRPHLLGSVLAVPPRLVYPLSYSEQ